MPAYAYSCLECHTHFQVRKSIAHIDTETPCPECGTVHTQRLISAVAVFSASGGERRALAGSSGCSGCGMAATGCTSCGTR